MARLQLPQGFGAKVTTVTSGGGSDAYGSKPVLPTTGQLQTDITGILNQAIPNFSGLSGQASSIIGDAMSGRLPQDVQNLIQDRAATQAVMGGLPGTSNLSGSLFGNRTLRDLGITSLGQQQQGVKDLISLLQGFSGVAAPTFAQAQEQANAIAKYESAPDPSAAAAEQERLYNKYSNPAAGSGGRGMTDAEWNSPFNKSIGAGGNSIQYATPSGGWSNMRIGF